MTVKGRAETPEQRRQLLEEMGKLWDIPEDLRLGQLIYNAVGFWLLENDKPCKARDVSDHIFYVEDDNLLTTIAKYVMEKYPPRASTSA